MIEITAPDYCLMARQLRERIGTAEWFNGHIEMTFPGFEARLTLSAIVYRRTERWPEGECRPIADVVPVWWEFSTVTADGPEVNDFSFSELRPWLVDN
jgi:hypothetical protein